ncbi:hypothetical protein EJ08DRAFT_691812 [Tothia fuscella]|uniref:Uncharacterized protein n=1 Tax=Tothia fuscella TaxID=1048955 RepID=A0A9P4P3B9_9PEZI|nr:hypothetical protein EJ08DRAFT_691812 [Tothia fuscella]
MAPDNPTKTIEPGQDPFNQMKQQDTMAADDPTPLNQENERTSRSPLPQLGRVYVPKFRVRDRSPNPARLVAEIEHERRMKHQKLRIMQQNSITTGETTSHRESNQERIAWFPRPQPDDVYVPKFRVRERSPDLARHVARIEQILRDLHMATHQQSSTSNGESTPDTESQQKCTSTSPRTQPKDVYVPKLRVRDRSPDSARRVARIEQRLKERHMATH